MGKKLLLSAVFVGVFACAVVANIPLLFVLRQSGLVQQGVSWQQARGTVWHGQVTGLVVRGDVAGAVEGDFSLMRVLKGQPGHMVRWSGPYGRGSALASLASDGIRIRKGQAALTFDAARISASFPAQDVSLRLTNVSIDAGRTGCREASGRVTTDVLSRVSAVYGATWPELTGTLSCDRGQLAFSMEGRAVDGTQISANAYLDGGGRLELWDVPEDQASALLLAGFTNEAGRFVYSQESGEGERSQ